MSCTISPSSRMRPLRAKKSFTGADRMARITAPASSVPAACTAFK